MEGRFYLSANRGVNWTEINLPPVNEGLFFIGISGQRVITTIGSEIYRTGARTPLAAAGG